MVDVFVMVEGYCHLFVERLDLVGKEKLVFFTVINVCYLMHLILEMI